MTVMTVILALWLVAAIAIGVGLFRAEPERTLPSRIGTSVVTGVFCSLLGLLTLAGILSFYYFLYTLVAALV